jgi:trigger factor
MVEHNHIPDMVAEVVRGKSLATIVESAKVTDESGNQVELKLLQPDGSIGEPQTVEAPAEEPAEGTSGDDES